MKKARRGSGICVEILCYNVTNINSDVPKCFTHKSCIVYSVTYFGCF